MRLSPPRRGFFCVNHRHVQIATDGCYGAFKGNDGGFSSCPGRFRSLCLRRDDREGRHRWIDRRHPEPVKLTAAIRASQARPPVLSVAAAVGEIAEASRVRMVNLTSSSQTSPPGRSRAKASSGHRRRTPDKLWRLRIGSGWWPSAPRRGEVARVKTLFLMQHVHLDDVSNTIE